MRFRNAGWVVGLSLLGLLGCSSDDKQVGQGTGGTSSGGGGTGGGGTGGTAGNCTVTGCPAGQTCCIGPSGGLACNTQCGDGGMGGGGELGCVQSGGTVITSSCCAATGDFPDTCAVGACSCSPTNSHDVKACDCPSGCFDGIKCTGGSGGAAGGGGTGGAAGGGGTAGSGGAAGGGGTGGSGGAAADCVKSGGTVVTQLCCSGAGDFPNMCGVGTCGCSPSNSTNTQICSCPGSQCFDGTACK